MIVTKLHHYLKQLTGYRLAWLLAVGTSGLVVGLAGGLVGGWALAMSGARELAEEISCPLSPELAASLEQLAGSGDKAAATRQQLASGIDEIGLQLECLEDRLDGRSWSVLCQ